KAARAVYPHSPAQFLAELTQLLKSLRAPDRPGIGAWLKGLFGFSRASGDAAPTALAGLRSFINALFHPPGGSQVPLRDLADHAPINYFSGIGGRPQLSRSDSLNREMNAN